MSAGPHVVRRLEPTGEIAVLVIEAPVDEQLFLRVDATTARTPEQAGEEKHADNARR